MKRIEKLDERPAVVQRLYEVFARYLASAQTMEACSCCTTKSEVAALFSEPLSQLSSENFWHYSFKAMTTWGDEYEWKHFLPRLLEIAMETDGPGTLGLNWVGNKFSYVQWRDWPDEEVLALRDFWRETVVSLAKRGDWDFANDWLEELARLDESGESGLEKWLQNAASEEVSALDEWTREWENKESNLANWTKHPKTIDKLLERL